MTKATLRAALLPLLIGLAGCANPEPDYQAQTEALLAPFAGPWNVASFDREGKKVAPRTVEVSVEKEKFRISETRPRAGGGGALAVADIFTDVYTLQVDPTKPPGEVDLTCTLGEKLGETRHAIYEFEGDRLRLCIAAPGEPRPAGFTATSKTTLLILVRKQ